MTPGYSRSAAAIDSTGEKASNRQDCFLAVASSYLIIDTKKNK
jgi:hypothetical protein